MLALADCVIELGEETGSPVGMATCIQTGPGIQPAISSNVPSLQSPNKQRKPGRLSPLSPDVEYPVHEKLATVREEKTADGGAGGDRQEEDHRRESKLK